MQHIRVDNWPGASLPGLIRADNLMRSIRIFNADLHFERGPVAVQIAPPGKPDIARIPAVAQNGPHPVFAFMQGRRHIIRLIGNSVAVVGPAGSQNVVPNLMALLTVNA